MSLDDVNDAVSTKEPMSDLDHLIDEAFMDSPKLAFPRISRQIMMSKLKRSHSNGTNQICRRVQVRGGQASHR